MCLTPPPSHWSHDQKTGKNSQKNPLDTKCCLSWFFRYYYSSVSVYYTYFSHTWNAKCNKNKSSQVVQWVGQEPSWVCCQQPRGGIIIRAGGFSTPSCPIRIWIHLNRAIYCTRVILGHLTCWGCLVHTLIANCSLRRQPLRWEWQEKKKRCLFPLFIHSCIFH